MAHRGFLLPTTVKSFADYFNLQVGAGEIANAFGYAYIVRAMTLPRAPLPARSVSGMVRQLRWNLENIPAPNEAAQRETIVAPILQALARVLSARVRIEYPIDASPQLRGKLDYLLSQNENLLIVEAKRGDTTRGMNQLTAELIALDTWADKSLPLLYGVVTSGRSWQFAVLDRTSRTILQDLATLTVPGNLRRLLETIAGVLTNAGIAASQTPSEPAPFPDAASGFAASTEILK